MNATDRTRKRLSQLRELLLGKSQVLIVLQDNPDPDAIAAAVAFRVLAHNLTNATCSIAHGGTIGRAENRALVRYLQLKPRSIDSVDISKFDLVVMLDTQPGTGNNSLPPEHPADIVIDHHPLRSATRQTPLNDVRPKYGATATILSEYLYAADITPDIPVATALLYAIRSDTQDLGRDTTRADIDTFGWLYPFANKRMLSEIQRGRVQRSYFYMLNIALENARVFGPCVITNIGATDNPDMIAEIADLLLRDDETCWSVCYGFCQQKALVSVRTSQMEFTAHDLIKYVVSRKGTGGGHATFAGGQIPLVKQTKAEQANIAKLIQRRILKALNVAASAGEKLVQNPAVRPQNSANHV